MMVVRTYIPYAIRVVMEDVWEHIKDDGPEQFIDWEPRLDDNSRWYVGYLDNELAGVFWMRRVNTRTWEAHANVRPQFWGDRQGTKLCREAIAVMIDDTGAKKTIALIPDSSPATQRMAEAIGFRREGVQTQSFIKDGQVYDQVHYGITRK